MLGDIKINLSVLVINIYHNILELQRYMYRYIDTNRFIIGTIWNRFKFERINVSINRYNGVYT